MEDLLVSIFNIDKAQAAFGALAIGGACSFVCAFLKAPTENSNIVYRALYAILNKVGGNVGRAKNADDVLGAMKSLVRK